MSKIAFGDVSDIIDRLNVKMTTLKTPAKHAWSIDPIDEYLDYAPTCVVYPGEQFSSRTKDSPVCRQQTQIGLIVMIISPIVTLSDVVEDVRKALLGWQVGDDYSIIKLSHQNVPYAMPVEIKADYIWWSETYQIDFLNRTI